MTDRLLFDGFYASERTEREEWHAGVCMRFVEWHYYRYFPNGDWISCYRPHPFDFWAFTEAVTPELLALAKRGNAPLIGDDDPLLWAGTYTIDDDILTENFTPDLIGGGSILTKRAIRERKVFFGEPADATTHLAFIPMRPD